MREAVVSDHYERAGRPAEAHRHALAAAVEAVAMSSHREAVELYRRAQRTAPIDIPGADRATLLAALAGELGAGRRTEIAVWAKDHAQPTDAV